MKYIVLTWVWPPRGNGWQNGVWVTYKAETQGNEAWSFVPVSISPRSDASTYLNYSGGGYCCSGIRKGVVDTSPHLNQCGGNHTESAWPLINKESHCYFHVHVFACADYVMTHVSSHLYSWGTWPPNLNYYYKLLGWYIIHHPCSCN